MISRAVSNDGPDVYDSVTELSATTMTSATQNPSHTRATPVDLQAAPTVLQQSRSVPNTPSQKAMDGNRGHFRSPSQIRNMNNSSPQSTQSDTSQTPPAVRKAGGACKYETGMAKARRRVPYSLGPDKLQPEPTKIRTRLSPSEEAKLTADMQKLYADLLPSTEDESRRAKFVDKLENILKGRWPGAAIKVNVFGSTGNTLGTADSDVDICITTDSKEMTKVCSIAELLANRGMERVVCVSSAKVPIVKIWDPELQVACDMNVNNPIALENTALVKNYVAIDPRVRPLAMIIKYWAKKRILNDAALGGTLSSYTWICLTLNFLQTRKPPILPSLQQNCAERLLDGVNVAFDKNVDSYKGYGTANKLSLGELLLQFFRYYGHEFDFEDNAISVRTGKLISKAEKGWHLLQDNRLCVEEPFNVSRNLANTADDTSMRGIHLELRRAFGLVADGHLDKCCEQYIYPPDEIKTSEHFVPPTSRPVIAQLPNQTSRSKPNNRGGRNSGHQSRNPGGRRSSNPGGRGAVYLRSLPFQMTTQELQLQQQHQQHLLHDQLFQQYQYLQLQEQELRMQLHQQNLRSRGLLPATHYPTPALAAYANTDENGDNSSTGGFSNTAHTSLSAPLHQRRFGSTSPYLPPAIPTVGVVTNPSSPHPTSAMLDTRRFPRRTSMTASVNATPLRAHSQPARPLAAPTSFNDTHVTSDINFHDGRRSSASSASQDPLSGYFSHPYTVPPSVYDIQRKPAEYVGYYVGQSPSLIGYPSSASISPVPSHIGLAIQNGGLSPRLATNTAHIVGVAPLPGYIDPLGDRLTNNNSNLTTESHSHRSSISGDKVSSASTRYGPLIVNGSINPSSRKQPIENQQIDIDEQAAFSTSTSEDLALDTPSSSDENSQDPLEFLMTATSAPPSSQTLFRARQPGRTENKLANGHVEETKPFTNGDVSTPDPKMVPLHKPATMPWSLGRQLSSVEEAKSPVPSDERPGSKSSSSPAPLTTRSQGKLDLGIIGTSGALLPKPNGSAGQQSPTTIAGSPSSNSAWQTQKKKKRNKKTVKSESDAANVNPAGGDFLPVDESQRKGG